MTLAIGATVGGVLGYNYCSSRNEKERFHSAKLVDKVRITDDLIKLRLRFDKPLTGSIDGLSHVVLKDYRTQIYRFYTPLLMDGCEMELVVRVYKDGLISNFLDSLLPGDSVSISDIRPTQIYEPNTVNMMIMMAGGTGILPFYHLATRILRDPLDKTSMFLIWACRTQNDFFLRNELLALARDYPGRIKVALIDTSMSPDPSGEASVIPGKINKNNLQPLFGALPINSDKRKTSVIVCGPDGFCKSLLGSSKYPGILESLGYERHQVHRVWEGG